MNWNHPIDPLLCAFVALAALAYALTAIAIWRSQP